MIEGGNRSIKLKDGRTANVDILELYRGFLGYMERNHSQMFNEACWSVHQGDEDSRQKIAAMKTRKNLDIAGFKLNQTETGEARIRVLWGNQVDERFYPNCRYNLHDDQIEVAIRLCATPTILSRIFKSVATDRPLSYKVVNPVKDDAKVQCYEYMWVGDDANNIFERNIIV